MTDDQVKLDFARPQRLGFDEAVLSQGKSLAQLKTIMDRTLEEEVSILMTRLEAAVFETFERKHREKIDYDPVSRTGFFNGKRPAQPENTKVGVVAAGSSDMPAAAEALRTLEYFGVPTTKFIDVGVAGLWRLTNNLDEIKKHKVIITVAGMDGALPSVLGGLVPGLIICLPTSTGYGASRGGNTALNAALASCAPGLCVVNIDNGYGAACAALRAVNLVNKTTV